MKTYGQYCPVARAADILGERWTLLILRDILGGARRFNEIRKGVPRMSPTLLSQRLKSLEICGLIHRRITRGTHFIEYLFRDGATHPVCIAHFADFAGRSPIDRMLEGATTEVRIGPLQR